jgi:hypothetical protein
VSWVIPTAFSVVALKQSLSCCRARRITARIQLGTDMLRDRACLQGGWNAGNGIVFGAPLTPHIDTTAIALLALASAADPAATQGLSWLQQTCFECSSAYSLAWSVLALSLHQDPARDQCREKLMKLLPSKLSILNIETLSLAAIAIKASESKANPFRVEV